MNKLLKRNLESFRRSCRPAYHVSPYGVHDQAIREHIKRGFGAGLTRVPGLLDQANKI